MEDLQLHGLKIGWDGALKGVEGSELADPLMAVGTAGLLQQLPKEQLTDCRVVIPEMSQPR